MYRNNAFAIQALVRDREVHRDVYVDPEIFELELEHLFPNSWVYVGHASQLAKSGDFITASIGRQPVLAVRHSDGAINIFHNRCPHKGTKIASEPCGNTGKFFRCPYHAWSFKTDGSLLAIPLKRVTTELASKKCRPARGFRRSRTSPSTAISFLPK